LRGFFILERPKLASESGKMKKTKSSVSCAGFVGSEFGAGGIFAAGKNPQARLAAQGLLVRNLEQEGSLPQAKIPTWSQRTKASVRNSRCFFYY